MTREQMLDAIRSAGVVGAGGAGFPTYGKLDKAVEHIIANGAECEPLLAKDRAAMMHGRDELLAGLEVMQQLTGARQVTLVVKHKNRDVARAYEPYLKQRGFQSLVHEDVYPAGDEYVLVYEVTGRRVPPGGLPLQVGCLVDNVETIVNVARAVSGAPVIEKYVTICGAVRRPVTTVVPVGISLAECLELAGGATVPNPTVLTGGLMMGDVASDLRQPVTKTMGGVIALPPDHYLVRRKTASSATYTRIGHGQCDQCSLCTELCPRYTLGYPIQPHLVMRTLLMTGEPKSIGSLWAQYCCECNICSLIACPEQLDPKNICVDAKQALKEHNLGRTVDELERLFVEPHPARKGREVPIATLYRRLGLAEYDVPAPFERLEFSPSRIRLSLQAHIGQPASPVVRLGQQVARGQVVGTVPAGQLGCPVHASVAGRVTFVDGRFVELTPV